MSFLLFFIFFQSSKEATKGLLSLSEMAVKEIRRQEQIAAKLEVQGYGFGIWDNLTAVRDIVLNVVSSGVDKSTVVGGDTVVALNEYI